MNATSSIGLFIILIVGVFIFIVYLRIKRKSTFNPKDLLEKKRKRFDTRMKGEEVREGLGRV